MDVVFRLTTPCVSDITRGRARIPDGPMSVCPSDRADQHMTEEESYNSMNTLISLEENKRYFCLIWGKINNYLTQST